MNREIYMFPHKNLLDPELHQYDDFQSEVNETSPQSETIDLKELDLDFMQAIIDYLKVPCEDIDMLERLQLPKPEMPDKRDIIAKCKKINELIKQAKLEISFLSYNKLLNILKRLKAKHPSYDFANCENVLKNFIESFIPQLNDLEQLSRTVKEYINIYRKVYILQMQSKALDMTDSRIGIYDIKEYQLLASSRARTDSPQGTSNVHSISKLNPKNSLQNTNDGRKPEVTPDSFITPQQLMTRDMEGISIKRGSFIEANKQFVYDINRPETKENEQLYKKRVIGRTFPKELRPTLVNSQELKDIITLMLNKMTATDVTSWNWGDTKVQNPIEYWDLLLRKNKDLNRNFLDTIYKIGRPVCALLPIYIVYSYITSDSSFAGFNLTINLLMDMMTFLILADGARANDNNPTWMINKLKAEFMTAFKILKLQQKKLSSELVNKNQIIKQLEHHEESLNDEEYIKSNKEIADLIISKRDSIAKLLTEIDSHIENAPIMVYEMAFIIASVHCLDVNLKSDCTKVEFNAQFYHDIMQMVMETEDLEYKIKSMEELNAIL